jgi:hypothetical protein
MQHRILTRLSVLALAVATIVATACSDDTGSVSPVVPTSAKTGTSGGTDSTGHPDTSGTTTPPPTSNGPVASIRVTPHTATLPIGYYLTIGVTALDANGAVVAGTPATFHSSDATIVSVVSDTGTIVGKALGTAKIYATVAGHTDSTTVTVTAAPATPPPTTLQPGVASFDMNVKVAAAVPGTDTSRTNPLAGAVVKLTRTGGVTGDTLATAIDAGSATTDANGNTSFKGLTGGAYMVDITPPAGSGLAAIKTGFAPPVDQTVNFTFVLRQKN